MATDVDFLTPGNNMQNYILTWSVNSQGRWNRIYTYDSNTNRLLNTGSGYNYTYDAHGNMVSMPHLGTMEWDYRGNLSKTIRTGNGYTAYYRYDSQGNRVRKVYIHDNITDERIYIGNYEIYRRKVSGTLDTERETSFVSDDQKRIAIVDTRNLPTPVEVTIRYQYDNHLGSACLELDGNAQVISYEEYHPFGTTSYRACRNATETSLKRYKYVGKERDEETGLYYYGARYYASWLCRFVSVDPLQFKYAHYTPYQYAGNKPISYIDLDGLEEAKKNDKSPNMFLDESQRLKLLNKTINFYYNQINTMIPSQNEVTQYEPNKRPISEVNLIKSIIREQLFETNDGYILVSPDDYKKALFTENTKTLLLNGTSEDAPVLLKVASIATYTTSTGIDHYITGRQFLSKFSKVQVDSNLSTFSKILKKSGGLLKYASKVLDKFGNISIVWEIMNAETPRKIDYDTIKYSTRKVISNYIKSKIEK